jgi:hypothetical protein
LGWFVRRDAGIAVGLCIGMVIAAAVWMVWRTPPSASTGMARETSIVEAKPSAFAAPRRNDRPDDAAPSGSRSAANQDTFTKHDVQVTQNAQPNRDSQASTPAIIRPVRGRHSGDL